MKQPQAAFWTVASIALLPCLAPAKPKAPEPQKAVAVPLSEETEECIDCHKDATPGIYQDWLRSEHAKVTPAKAMKRAKLARRMSADKIPAKLREVAVGCFECHSLNTRRHADSFTHEGHRINVVVSPPDCRTCHPDEVDQFAHSKKAHAIDNLRKNPVYHKLVKTITGVKRSAHGKLSMVDPSDETLGQTCFGCHGMPVEVRGTKKVSTDYGDFEFPVLTNWPNQGVGRINPDGSRGACTSCHPRHSFSIAVARKPYTCGQCHLEPDVPAFNVYKESKHGNIFDSSHGEWNFKAVPWRVGQDFRAPTCATCHNSLVVDSEGAPIVERTHDFGARLWVRIFGLIYAHPQPRKGATYRIKNRDGQPMPTTFDNVPASAHLLSPQQQSSRRGSMRKLCQGCHTSMWADGHFRTLDKVVGETNGMVLEATKLMQQAWKLKVASPQNPFDEPIERLWINQWLLYANSIRYAAAMSGPDYASFKNGWYQLSGALRKMHDEIRAAKAAKPAP